MIINNLLRKLFSSGKSSFFRQNINSLKKTSLSKNPVDGTIILIFGMDKQKGVRVEVKRTYLYRGWALALKRH